MGGAVKAITKPLAGVVNFAAKATGLGKAGKWKDRDLRRDPNRLAYQQKTDQGFLLDLQLYLQDH